MKWTRLQLGALPVIAVEADSAIQKLQELVQRVNLYARNDDINDLNTLRQEILNRIQALDRFYEQNYLDSTISIFHMIKLKLKKAVFKIPNINNDTVTIQLTNFDQNKQLSSSKITEAKVDVQTVPSKLKIQLKPKSKSKSKLKSKDNLLKLLETSRRQQEEETNLMEELNNGNGKSNFFEHSFDFKRNQEDQPLFKTYTQAKNEQIQKKKQIGKLKNSEVLNKDKSLSPIVNKSFKSEINAYENKKKSPLKSESNLAVKGFEKNKSFKKNQESSKFGSHSKNLIEKTIGGKRDTVKQASDRKQGGRNMKTEGEQIRIIQEQKQNENPGEFRFTIKMTKQEYLNLLKMKQKMKKGMII